MTVEVNVKEQTQQDENYVSDIRLKLKELKARKALAEVYLMKSNDKIKCKIIQCKIEDYNAEINKLREFLKEKVWKCGAGDDDDVIATLEGTTLTISGEGKMKDYAGCYGNGKPWLPSSPPWYNKANTIVVQPGITHIGGGSFRNCRGLTSVDISNTVESIGYEAFRGCTALRLIDIPDSIERIEDYVFSGCNSLSRIINRQLIPQNVSKYAVAYKITRMNKDDLCSQREERGYNFKEDIKKYPYSNYAEDYTEYGYYPTCLYVPASVISKYKVTPHWENFKNNIFPIPISKETIRRKAELLEEKTKYQKWLRESDNEDEQEIWKEELEKIEAELEQIKAEEENIATALKEAQSK